MNVKVTLNSGLEIFPTYAPEHQLEVLDFYAKQYLAGLIRGYKVTLDNGSLLSANGVF